jgi:hypothetical protein
MAKRYQREIWSSSKPKNKLLAIALSVILIFGLGLLITLWYLLAIDCLSFFALRLLLITLWYLLDIALSVILRLTASEYSLVSFGHCIVCHTSVYGFWLPFGIFWTLHCLSFFGLRLFVITLWYLLAIALSVILYDYFWLPFGILWQLYCMLFFGLLLLQITLWYLLAIVLSVILLFTITYNTIAKGYQRVIRSNRKEWQTMQWPKDTKG